MFLLELICHRLCSQPGNATLSTSTEHIVLEEDDKGVENARLTIESVLLSDYTDYTCEARNNATDITGKPAQVTITVRIRGTFGIQILGRLF